MVLSAADHSSLADLAGRTAYLKGLVRGLSADASGRGRILAEVAGILGDLIREVTRLQQVLEENSPPGRAAAGRPAAARAGHGAGRTSGVAHAATGATRTRGGPASASSRNTFLACDCPHCGGDVFLQVEPLGDLGPEPGLHGRDVWAGAGCDYTVSCPHCGEMLHVYTPPRPDGRPERPRRRPPGAAARLVLLQGPQPPAPRH